MSTLRHLVVVVPGIGGSVLAEPDGTSAWDLTGRDLTRSILATEHLDIERELIPVRPVDDLVVLRPWFVVSGYSGLTQQLRKQFGVGLRVADQRAAETVPVDVDVLRVAYDFRRSVAESADLLGRTVTAAIGDSGRRVVVVAHSLGGLVARYWIGARGGWRHCRALITLGTPHRGAPRALDWLVNGAGVGPFRSASATRVLRDWPSVHELLPQYPSVLGKDGVPLEVDALVAEVVRSFGVPTAGTDLLRRAADAARVHRDIDAGWAAIPEGERPALLPYFGRGHTTLNRAVLHDGRVRVEKADPEWRGNVGWFGDGTVPSISAIPAELSGRAEQAQAVPDKHGPMGSTTSMIEKLVTLQGDDLPTRGTDRPPMPWVGWDVDDTVAAGHETVVGATLHSGAAAPVDTTGSGANVVLTGAGRPLPLAMAPVGAGWRTVLPPLPEGVYQLDVEIKDAWFGTPVYASTPLAALDPHAEEQS